MCTGVRGMYLRQKCIWAELWVEAIFIYIDSYFVYLFFSRFVSEFGGATATALYVLYPSFFFFFFPVIFQLKASQFTQQYTKTRHQQPSDVKDSKASHRRCNAKCRVHSMNNIKPQRLSFFGSVFVESVFALSECSAAQSRWETVRKSRLKGCILRRSQSCAFFYAKEHRKWLLNWEYIYL